VLDTLRHAARVPDAMWQLRTRSSSSIFLHRRRRCSPTSMSAILIPCAADSNQRSSTRRRFQGRLQSLARGGRQSRTLDLKRAAMRLPAACRTGCERDRRDHGGGGAPVAVGRRAKAVEGDAPGRPR